MDLIKSKIGGVKDQMLEGLSVFAPSNLKKKIKEIKQMSSTELAVGFCRLLFLIMYHSAFGVFYVLRKIWQALMGLMQGPPAEKVSLDDFGSLEEDLCTCMRTMIFERQELQLIRFLYLGIPLLLTFF